MPKSISDNGLHFVAAWEKFQPVAYRATPAEKYLTIGYGHYGPDVQPGQKITQGQALLLLNRDMASAVAAVNEVAAPNLTQAQLDAMYDLVFNAGAGVISAATGTGIALRAGNIGVLRMKLGRFIFQGGKILLGLRRRAAARQALFDGKSWQEAEVIGRAVK